MKGSLIGHGGGGFRTQQTLVEHSLPLEGGCIEPFAVVGNLNGHATRLVKGPQRELSGPVFSLCEAFFRHLQPVVDGIPDHVNQWVADLFEDGLIELNSLPFDNQPHFFSQRSCEVSYQAREFLENGLDREHPNRHDGGLQFVGDPGNVRSQLSFRSFTTAGPPAPSFRFWMSIGNAPRSINRSSASDRNVSRICSKTFVGISA